jgi:hypothetical protein
LDTNSAVVQVDIETGDVPLDTHEEQVALLVLVLVGMEDVGVVAIEEVGHGGDDALAVGAVDQEDAGLCHGDAPAHLTGSLMSIVSTMRRGVTSSEVPREAASGRQRRYVDETGLKTRRPPAPVSAPSSGRK